MKKRTQGNTVIVGDKPFESLAAEFADLAEPVKVDTPPAGSATILQLCKVWNVGEMAARRRVEKLIEAGQLRFIGKYRIKNGQRGVYPIAHYVRVRTSES